MKLLLISNSTNPGEEYLQYPSEYIRSFLGPSKIKALFIPYAAVTFSFDEYEDKVSERFKAIGHAVYSIHRIKDLPEAVSGAEAIVVGGGNTWQLLKSIHEKGLAGIIREKVLNGTPYIGWSAGSNVACPTIRTTNDMPIVEPGSFSALGLVPFQINPHYTDFNPPGHGGETREQRIMEFIEANPGIYVAGLREGTMLIRDNDTLRLIGDKTVRLFRKGSDPEERGSGDDLSFLLRGF